MAYNVSGGHVFAVEVIDVQRFGDVSAEMGEPRFARRVSRDVVHSRHEAVDNQVIMVVGEGRHLFESNVDVVHVSAIAQGVAHVELVHAFVLVDDVVVHLADAERV